MWGRTPRQVQGSPSSQNPNTQATHAGPAATPRPTHGLCARWGTDPGRPGPPGPEAPQPRRLAASGPALQPGAGPRPSRPGHRPAGAGQSRGRPTRVIPQSRCGQESPRSRSPGQRRISGAVRGHGAGASPTQRAAKVSQPQRRVERVAAQSSALRWTIGRATHRRRACRASRGQSLAASPAGPPGMSAATARQQVVAPCRRSLSRGDRATRPQPRQPARLREL